MLNLVKSFASNAIVKLFKPTSTIELFSVSSGKKVGEVNYVAGSSKSLSLALLDALTMYRDEMKTGLWYINPFTDCRQMIRVK